MIKLPSIPLMRCAVLTLGVIAFQATPAFPSEPKAGRSTAYPGGVWEPGPPKYGSMIVDEVPVTMDDGVILRASIAYPTDRSTGKRATGKFPVVIEHTPYVKFSNPVGPNTYLTEHGYIYAVVRVRGMGTSGGDVQFFGRRDGLDGKAIVDWAAHRLKGSDGRVALLGCSYPGGMAITDAAYVGPGSPVKAVIAASMGLASLNRQSFMVGGLPTTGFWNYTANGPVLWGNSPSGTRFMKQFVAELQEGGDAAYDRDFWRDRRQMWLAQKVADNGIPLLLWSGWRDIVETGAVRAYAALQNACSKRPIDGPMLPNQQASPRYQMILGDWPHGIGLDAGIYLQWLETWVRGVDTGIQKTRTPFHVFETGTNRWINLARYPVVSNYTTLNLDESGLLPSGTTPTRGTRSLSWGPAEQPNSKLAYTTQPFEEGATLAGPISAKIYAASSNTNLVLIAKLYDIAPDGTESLVTKGALLGSQRELDSEKSWADSSGVVIWPWPRLKGDSYMRPGEVYRLDIALAPRQRGILPGHRLRFELTTQSPKDVAPDTGVPPQNGTDPCRLTAPQQATVPGGVYTIMHGSQWPSSLNLPLLPLRSFEEVPSGVLPTAWSENQRTLIPTALTLPLKWESEH